MIEIVKPLVPLWGKPMAFLLCSYYLTQLATYRWPMFIVHNNIFIKYLCLQSIVIDLYFS
jgi:hypothetical protein